MSFLYIPVSRGSNGNNTFVGVSALRSITTGSNNSAFGLDSLLDLTTGSGNSAFGQQSLSDLISGSSNCAFGNQALLSLDSGSFNVAFGQGALRSINSGSSNVAIGTNALFNLSVSLGNNTAVGNGAGSQITTGGENTILGCFSGNQGGLDIRTLDGYIVLSDGAGNPRLWSDNTGAIHIPGGTVFPSGTPNAILYLDGSGVVTSSTSLEYLPSITGASTDPLVDISGTWNTSGAAGGIRLDVTDTASAAGALLMDLQVGGASKARVEKSGNISLSVTTLGQGLSIFSGVNKFSLGIGSTNKGLFYPGTGTSKLALASSFAIFASDVALGFAQTSDANSGSGDVFLNRDAANTLAQRNGVNPQTFRVYNTFTDASNYERGRFAWVSNVLTIGTENAGTGLARELSFITGGVEQARLNSTGFGIGTNSPTTKLEVQGGGVLVNFLSTNNNNVVRIRGNNATNGAWIGTSNADDFFISTGPSITERVRIPGVGGMVIGDAAIATNATNGFLYVPGCAGTPTGTPTAYTGRVPIVVDTTNNKLYFYSGGAWRDAGP